MIFRGGDIMVSTHGDDLSHSSSCNGLEWTICAEKFRNYEVLVYILLSNNYSEYNYCNISIVYAYQCQSPGEKPQYGHCQIPYLVD